MLAGGKVRITGQLEVVGLALNNHLLQQSDNVSSHRISGSDCSLGDFYAGRFERLAELPPDSPAAGHVGIGFDSNPESIRRRVPHHATLDQVLRAKHHSSGNGVCAFKRNKTNLYLHSPALPLFSLSFAVFSPSKIPALFLSLLKIP